MGGGSWTAGDWVDYASKTSGKSTGAVFTARYLDPYFNPKGISVRESCDSDEHPASTPIILAVDVTGSMGSLADALVRGDAEGNGGLGTLMREIYDRKPVTDPQVACMAIGDSAAGDQAPLQVSQFESDIRIAEQLQKVWIEGGGGGNSGESYLLAWYFAALKTKCDSLVKRKKKGYLFTIGDERYLERLWSHEIQSVFGDSEGLRDYTAKELFNMAQRGWEIFHLVVEESPSSRYQDSLAFWRDLLGQRAIPLADHRKMPEVIVSLIQVNEGLDAERVASSWDGSTNLVVSHAVEGLVAASKPSAGVVRL